MIERFQGEAGQALLREAILDQQCVAHDQVVADALLRYLEIEEFKANFTLMEQGHDDNHIYLILAGRVSICVNGRELAIRGPRQHVGEMAMLDPAAKRSATVIAMEDTVVAKIVQPVFSAIANDHPDMWRRLAMEIANRLRQRAGFVRQPNPRPVIFIGCSVEGLGVAEYLQLGLSHAYVVPQIWTNNLFIPGHGTMEDLEQRISTADFGVLVCTPDDRILNEERDVDQFAPRDNVILELGMCIGALGRRRALLVKPRSRDLKIPSDLLGITHIDYDASDAANLAVHLGPACTLIKQVIGQLGTR